MNRVTRVLAIAGLSLGAAVAIGAGPAQAAPSTGQTTAGSTTQARGWDDDEVVGYFNSRRECERVGRIGERRDRWDDYDCDRVRGGFGRGTWVLEVSDWNDGWDNHNWYGGWYNNWRGGDWRGGWDWFRGGHHRR